MTKWYQLPSFFHEIYGKSRAPFTVCTASKNSLEFLGNLLEIPEILALWKSVEARARTRFKRIENSDNTLTSLTYISAI